MLVLIQNWSKNRLLGLTSDYMNYGRVYYDKMCIVQNKCDAPYHFS